jgi:Helix-turn-helix domain of transposase family ISL3
VGVTTAFSRLLHLPGIWVRQVAFETDRVAVTVALRRLDCPTHGVRTEGVPFARSGSRFTRDFEDLVGFLATTADKTTICRLVRIDWDTVGRILTGVMADRLDPNRLEPLFEIGVDEVSWRKRHNYLTLVSTTAPTRWCGAPRADTPWTASSTNWPRARRADRCGIDGHVGRLRQVRRQGRARPHSGELL